MNKLVLDANVAVDWFCRSKEGEAYSLPLQSLAVVGLVRFQVPLHFDVEVTRVLRKQHLNRPAVFTLEWLRSSLQLLDLLEIESIAQGVNFSLMGDLAMSYNLDVPDVPYLHLARMMELPIATRDGGIVAACKHWNVLHWQPNAGL